MTGKYHVITFRWIFPIAQLLLCIIMLWPLRHMLIREVRISVEAYRSHGRSLQNHPIPFNIHPSPTTPQVRIVDPNLLPPDMLKEHPELIPITLRLWGPALLNLPAGLAELPYSLAFDNGRFCHHLVIAWFSGQGGVGWSSHSGGRRIAETKN